MEEIISLQLPEVRVPVQAIDLNVSGGWLLIRLVGMGMPGVCKVGAVWTGATQAAVAIRGRIKLTKLGVSWDGDEPLAVDLLPPSVEPSWRSVVSELLTHLDHQGATIEAFLRAEQGSVRQAKIAQATERVSQLWERYQAASTQLKALQEEGR